MRVFSQTRYAAKISPFKGFCYFTTTLQKREEPVMDIDVNKFREFFAADRFAANAGIRIEQVAENSVVCSLELGPGHRNAGGSVQGGAIFTLADFAFAVHSNIALVCGENTGITVGQSCSISYLKATRGKRLIAKTSCLSRGKSMSVYQVAVEDDLGVPIAEFTGNAFTMAKKN
jgi:acyl-CoA thioesterase